MTPTLAIKDLKLAFRSYEGLAEVLHGISLTTKPGERVALVGESGSGKSTLANMILGIYPPTAGGILMQGAPLPKRRALKHRRAIQLVQQNPLSSLNPKRTVGASIRLALDVHDIDEHGARAARIETLVGDVGLPQELDGRAPAALSGGQRQRIAIARALACEPDLLILDEPTSALDVLVQARVLKLLNDLRATRGLTYVFITHDLSVVRNVADRVAVFERGRLVELGTTPELFSSPKHTYTRRLFSAISVITPDERTLRDSLAAEA